MIGCTELPKKLTEILIGKWGRESVMTAVVSNVLLAAILILSVAFIVDASYNPFLYFRF